MTIALTASTGKIGTALLNAATATAARERDLTFRALARDPARLRSSAGEVRSFDFTEPATYGAAFEGVETLVLVSPSSPRQGATDIAVVDAARKAGVRHVIKVSGEAADRATTRFGGQHQISESHLRATGDGWTIVRPTFFMENLLGLGAAIAAGTYPAPTGAARMSQIAVDDIAAVLLAIVTSPERHRGATYTLTGPAASTGDEIAAALAAARGHDVRHVDVLEDAFREDLARAGLDPWTLGGLLEAYRRVRSGEASNLTDDVTRLTGRAPMDLATWARAHATAF
jgi:uncharacterized protein YbjT (DUF2867 family)